MHAREPDVRSRGSVSPGRPVRLPANRLGPPHLGHAKTYTQFDFLIRLLRARGFAVTYVQNITDVDDKIIRRRDRAAGSAGSPP
jgi:hypothetical protein